MFTLPQLLEEDIQRIDAILREMLKKSDASLALLIDQGGFLIASQGNAGSFDLTSIAALSSGAFMATQTIAGLVEETSFSSVYQQGETHSIFITAVDQQCQLVVIFQSSVGVGVVKYYASAIAEQIAAQMKIAAERNPEGGVDLSILNLADPSAIFRRQS
ncbi:MAG: roadblock/LC7 domain-containing protein [Verrucomicrobia bacterium]|jgi:predicted regulator of Ras-like GTPase activity (Roadblock/LC7/MglB family)|nr:roadblock/LC7 domain-containing protein [Verrucomicrobiota bacterium]